jgi:hypothetical protein
MVSSVVIYYYPIISCFFGACSKAAWDYQFLNSAGTKQQ